MQNTWNRKCKRDSEESLCNHFSEKLLIHAIIFVAVVWEITPAETKRFTNSCASACDLGSSSLIVLISGDASLSQFELSWFLMYSFTYSHESAGSSDSMSENFVGVGRAPESTSARISYSLRQVAVRRSTAR